MDKGTLILQSVPVGDRQKNVEVLLSKVFRKAPRAKLAKMMDTTPVVLSREVSEKAADTIIASLEKLGAKATFRPRNLESLTQRSAQKPVPHVATAYQPAAAPSVAGPSAKPINDLESNSPSSIYGHSKNKLGVFQSLASVNKELWLIFSMLVIAGVMNYLITAQEMLLGLYTLPTLFSAYFFGKRHAILTAFASIFLVGLLSNFNPDLFGHAAPALFVDAYWYQVTAWGGILILTAFATGTLHEHHEARVQELRKTYHGLLLILRQFISKDKYTENHSYRVSIYAAKIAAYLGMHSEQIEDVRAASLLHDIGKLDISRELLYKASRLTHAEYEGMKQHVDKGADMLEAVGGPLHRIIPIIIAHHERMDGSGYRSVAGQAIPMEARVVAVADVYDSLTSDRPYRKAMSPYDAKAVIVKGSGAEFDPAVVKAFLEAFGKGEMEVPEVVL